MTLHDTDSDCNGNLFFPSHAVDDNVILPDPSETVGSNSATITLQLNPDIDVTNDATVISAVYSDDDHVTSGFQILSDISQVGFKNSPHPYI